MLRQAYTIHNDHYKINKKLCIEARKISYAAR